MKLQLNDSNETFDAPRGIALALIKVGAAIEFVPPKAPEVPIVVTWAVEVPVVGREFPRVVGFCGKCRSRNVLFGDQGEFLNSRPCCGVPERDVPPGKFHMGSFMHDGFVPPAKCAEKRARAVKFLHCNRIDVIPEDVIQKFIASYGVIATNQAKREAAAVNHPAPMASRVIETPDVSEFAYSQSDGFAHGA